jgi:hypothetical protein
MHWHSGCSLQPGPAAPARGGGGVEGHGAGVAWAAAEESLAPPGEERHRVLYPQHVPRPSSTHQGPRHTPIVRKPKQVACFY